MASCVPTARKSAGLGAGTATAGFAGEGTNQSAEQPSLAPRLEEGQGRIAAGRPDVGARTEPCCQAAGAERRGDGGPPGGDRAHRHRALTCDSRTRGGAALGGVPPPQAACCGPAGSPAECSREHHDADTMVTRSPLWPPRRRVLPTGTPAKPRQVSGK